MTKKVLKEDGLKKSKLDKTRDRRKRLSRGRWMAEVSRTGGRNDLLPDLEIQRIPVTELRPPRNRTRADNPDQVERLVKIIARYGFTDPILVRDGQVLDGWSRVRAARELNLHEIPAIECAHLDAAEARALALAFNRIGERGEWDLDALRIEFEELIELDIDLVDTGFTLEEQDIILIDPLENEKEVAVEGAEGTQSDPVTQTGDVWKLGNHRIICGDALEQTAYKALLVDECADAVVTDPPYNVKIKRNVSGLGKTVHDEFAMASGEMSDEEFQSFLDEFLSQVTTWLVAGAVLFIFMDWRSIHRVYSAGSTAKLTLLNLVVWYKQSGGMGALYRSAHELIAVLCNGDQPRVNSVQLGRHGRDRTNVWAAPGANRPGSSANEMLAHHATPKPVELCVDALLDVTERGDIVLDVFLGSGATLIAAEKTGRRCRGIELDPGFVDVCIRRWEKQTGVAAVLVSTGETFAETTLARTGSTETDEEGEAT